MLPNYYIFIIVLSPNTLLFQQKLSYLLIKLRFIINEIGLYSYVKNVDYYVLYKY